MVSIVLPYKHSLWNDTEIRYSLRSIEKHLHNYGELFIIGDKPKGITNYIHIPFVDDTRRVYKERNIYLKVMEAVNDTRVTEDFLFVNDDHFLNSDYDADKFPYYYGDWPVRTDMYKQTISNTLPYIEDDGLDNACFYDVHCPMLFNKTLFVFLVSTLIDWNVKAGYCMKSLYANLILLFNRKEYYPDLKIKTIERPYDFMNLIKDRLWFSTDDQMRDNSMEALLKNIYPNKSKWEICSISMKIK